MKRHRLSDMKGGWFVGDFSPVVLRTPVVEVGCKHYRAGDSESAHVHRIAVELTLIASGRVRMNGVEYVAGDVVEIAPGEATDFVALDDTTTVIVKMPSVAGDKYPATPARS